MEEVKLVSNLWGEYLPADGAAVIMVTDLDGHNFSIADITLTDEDIDLIENQFDDDKVCDYLFDIAFEVARDLGYVFEGYVDNGSDTMVLVEIK